MFCKIPAESRFKAILRQTLDNLFRLDLDNTGVTDDGLMHLESLANLGWLGLTGSTRITDAGVSRLQESLPRTHVHTSRSPRLVIPHIVEDEAGELHLVGDEAGLPPFMEMRDPGQIIAEIEELGGEVTFDEDDPDRPVIGVNVGMKKVTDFHLRQLATFASLQWLDLSVTRVTDAGLKYLRDLTDLVSLDLNVTAIGDEGLQHLRELVNLCSLDLCTTQITDAGLRHLKGLTNLTHLALATTCISDLGLEHLEGLASLDTLSLLKTKVTNRGCAKLRQALPNTQIFTNDMFPGFFS